MGVELYKHNKVAYEKVEEMLKTEDKACVVHATGTGKSFIALKLIYDFIIENPDSKVMFLAPLSGIGDQIREHISTMNLPDGIFDNVQFNNYQTLVAKTEEELKNIDFDLLVLDEFHHIGAPEWTKRLQMIIEANPEAKIFGMSATSVRSFGTKYEEDVAESFFEGNVASRYDLAQAIVDGVLPQPNYHAALAVLEGDCEELERKINSGSASPEEKQQYQKVLSDIRKKISEGESADEIIRNHIKRDGKYIYFCPKGSDISILQDNIKRMLPTEYINNIEFYQVHSSAQTDKQNNLNSNNFYHNITLDGQSAMGKLRIMFAIDMYNEGIHVPDIDGVIMGRATKSDITFYQQLGRALAVKKKSEGTGEKVSPPLVIDLMGNLKEIKRLYLRVETRKASEGTEPIERSQGNGTPKDEFDINFGLSEEIINLLSTLEELKSKVEFTLDFDGRLKEVYDYLQKNGRLPKWDEETKFTDGRVMSTWITQKRLKIYEKADSGNEIAKTVCEQFSLDPDELFLIHLEEALVYCKEHNGFPRYDDNVTFSTGTQIHHWSRHSKEKIEEYALKGNETAKKLYSYYTLTIDESFNLHIDEMYEYIQRNGRLPQKSKNEKFSDGKLMSAWLNKNRRKIEQSGLEDNDKSKTISEMQKMNSKTKENKDRKTVDRIIEILAYYDRNGKLPTDTDKAEFENGADMANWLSSKSVKDSIQRLLEQNNSEAIRLTQIQYSLSSDGIFERKMSELVELIKKRGTNVKSISGDKFSDESDIYSWILNKRSKIEEYASKGNQLAIFILENQYSEKAKTKSRLDTYDIHIKELITYYQEHGTLPKSTERIRFSDGNLMTSWIGDTKALIKEKADSGDEIAKIAYDIIYRNSEQGKFEIHTLEILQYYKENGILPMKKSVDKEFSDGGSMCNWVFNERKKIYEQMENLPTVAELAKLILAVSPTFFDKVKAFKEAEEAFSEESEFEKAKGKKGVKKGNGK